MSEKDLLKDETLAKKLITKGSWIYLFLMFSAPIGYLLRMLVSNSMSVADVGIFYSVLGLITLFSTYNDLGLTESLQYFLPKYWIKGEKNALKTSIVFALCVQIVTGVFIFCLLYFGAGWLAEHHFHDPNAVEIIRIMCFYFLGVNILHISNAIFIAFQDTFRSGMVETVRMGSTLLFTLIFWWTQALTNVNYSLAWIIGVFGAIIVAGVLVQKNYRYLFFGSQIVWDKIKIKTQMRYSFWAFLGANAWLLLGQIDLQMVVNILGPEAAGYFTNYNSLLLMFFTIVNPFLALLFPITTELIEKQDHKKLGMLQNFMYKYFGIFALIVSGFLFAFGPELAVILFGDQFFYSGHLLQFAVPFLMINSYLLINFNIMAGLGKVKERLIIVASAVGVNVLLNCLFMLVFGWELMGVILAVIISRFVLFGRSFWFVNKNEKIDFDWKFFVRNLLGVALLVCIMMIWGKKYFVLEDSMRWWNVLWIVSFLLIYVVILLGLNRKEIRLFLGEVKKLKKGEV